MTTTVVITDTSVLINFLAIDQIDLLSRLTHFQFVVTDHVRAEITEHFPEQLQRLHEAFSNGVITEITVTDLIEVRLFAELTAQGLGTGECSAFAVAINRKTKIAIDDKRAVKKLIRLGYHVDVLGTSDLIVSLIKEGLLSIERADQIKKTWEEEHRFKLSFASFSELTSEKLG